MVFKKGHKINVGNQYRKGKSPINAFPKNHIPWNKDKTYTKDFIIEHGIGMNPNSRNGFGKHENRNIKKRNKTMIERYGSLGTYGHLNKPHSEETKQLLHNQRIGKSFKELYGEERSIEIRKFQSQKMKGNNLKEKNGAWKGGIAFLPYPYEFNNNLKEHIRNSFGRICGECKYSETELGYTLNIHHIDYNKNNNSEENLIPLCNSCHAQTNFKREDWTIYFQNALKGGIL